MYNVRMRAEGGISQEGVFNDRTRSLWGPSILICINCGHTEVG